MPHENKIYLLILGKTRSTRQLWGAATPHSLRRRFGAYTMGFHPKPVDIIHDLAAFCKSLFLPLCVF